MKLSIITVCLNSEKTIETTIKSVIEQNYDNLEYIIVDGQSTDGTLDIIDKYKDKISVLISEPDLGIYDAMNKGISVATGDVIGIINSDDWYESGIFKDVIECFKNTKADLVYGNLNTIDELGLKVTTWFRRNIDELRYQMAIPHPTVFLKKEIYIKYGKFNLEYKIASDYDLMLRLYTKGIKFAYINKVIANFRLGGMSTSETEKCANETYTIAKDYLNYFSLEEQSYINKKIDYCYRAVIFGKILSENQQYIVDKVNNLCNQKQLHNIIIWGSGKWGTKVYNILKQADITPMCFVDNNSKKWNTVENGISVLSPEKVVDFDGIVLIVVREYEKDILEQIIKMNNSKVICMTWEEMAIDFIDRF